jgi:FAD-linked sulfhydryl oxidase
LISVFFNPPVRTYFDPWTGVELSEGGVEHRGGDDMLDLERVMGGDVIMSKLTNETAKYAVGAVALGELQC